MNYGKQKRNCHKVITLIDIVLAAYPVWAIWKGVVSLAENGYGQRALILATAVFILLYIEFGQIYEAFGVSLHKIAEIVYAQGLTIVASDIIMAIVGWLTWHTLPTAGRLTLMLIIQLGLLCMWTIIGKKWCERTCPPQPTAIIYDERAGMEQLIAEYKLQNRFSVVLTSEVEDCLDNMELLSDVQVVFLSGVHSHDRNVILKHCIRENKDVFVIPRIGDVLMSGAVPMHMFHLPMLKVEGYSASPEYLFIKRVLDILLSLTAIILLSPLMLISAILIKATDGGPVLYRQTRLTQNGRPFEILKFRSMYVNAEQDGIARLSTGVNDSRVTPIGKIIRKFRIDELPQIFNILRGDLSICGPRPERPEIAAQYCETMPEFALRLQAKAGLTGYAQVYGKYNTTPYDKLQMDLMYIAHPSIIQDLKIMFATVKVIFIPESTEGVAEGQVTAEKNELEKV